MFIIALLFLVLLGILAVAVVFQNWGTLFSTNVHLTVLLWHLPGIPVLLLCVLGILLGGLILYVSAAHAARRDMLEMKVLRARIEDLEKAPAKAPSGGLSASFAPSVVPIPGFAPGGSMGLSGPTNPPGPAAPGPFGPAGSGPSGPAAPGLSGPAAPGPFGGSTGPGPSGSLGQWQAPASPPQNISPSSSGNTLSLPPRLFPPPPQQQQQPQQMGGPRPPFPHS